MSLTAFIRSEMTEILAEWTAFAEKIAPARPEDVAPSLGRPC